GKTVLDYLEALSRTFGYFRTEGVPVVMTGIEGKRDMERMLNALRAQPPRTIAGLPVTAFEDLRDERGRMGPLKGATDAAGRNFRISGLGDRGGGVLRRSGTERKAKTSVEAWSGPCPAGAAAEEWQRACREVDNLVPRLADDFQRQALHLIGAKPTR